jgi:hypothetical protein
MKTSRAEKERLQFSERKFKNYALSYLRYFPLDKFLENEWRWIKLIIGFNDRIIADKFLEYCEKFSRYTNVAIRSYNNKDEFVAEIFSFPDSFYLLPIFFSSKWFHLSSYVMLKAKRKEGNIEVFGDIGSLSRGLTRNLSFVEMPYKSRISIEKKELTRISNSLKHLLLQYFGLEERDLYYTRRLISIDCLDRYLAYEQLSEKESHIRWRIDGKKLFARNIVDLEEILKGIILNDGFAIYPKLSRKYILKGEKVELQDKLVIEADPRNSSFENARKVMEIVDSILDEKKIERAILFSGSKSYRDHIALNSQEIVDDLDKLLDEFPYIGILSQKPVDELKEREKYRLVLKALSKALYVKAGLKMRKEREKVKFTSNKFYFDANAVLLDFPTSVSIAVGSPKSLMEIREAEKYDIDTRGLERIGYVPLCCIPVDKFYSKEEVYKLSGIHSAVNIAENSYKRYEEKMKRGIGIKEIRELLDVEESFIKNLQMKGDYWFLKKVVQA